MDSTTNVTDVIVVGAGVIGTATAWRCAQRGLSVTVIDPDPSQGAWRAAAGMLGPVSELHYTEVDLLALNRASLALYPAFVDELENATGLTAGYRECGTVNVAWDGADLAAMRDLHAFGVGLGVGAIVLDGRELRALEPALEPGLPGGLLVQDDHQVDPRRLHAALTAAAMRAGVRFVTGEARVDVVSGRVAGATTRNGVELRSDFVVLAAGAWSAAVDLPPENAPAVRPVKGQTLRLRLPGEPRLRHVVRASVRGTPVYLVPRSDGEILIGASSEEVGFDSATRAGAVYELLRDTAAIFPELHEATLIDVTTGFRPGSPDNAPIIGAGGLDGLVHATGHYRNGILLTPITADAVAELITTGAMPASLEPFSPSRFRQSVTP